MVHDLIKSLGLLDFEELKGRLSERGKKGDGEGESDDDDDNQGDRDEIQNEDKQEADGEPQRRTPDSPAELSTHTQDEKATVVLPDPSLGTKTCLLRYHDRSYIGESSCEQEEVELLTRVSERLLRAHTDEDPSDPTPSPLSSTSSPRPAKIARTDPYNLSHDNPVFPTLHRTSPI